MSISFSSSLMLSPLPFAMKPSLVIRARVRKWRRFELVTTANHEADVIRSDNSRWMTVERKSLASTEGIVFFFLKVWNYDLIPLFWNGQTGIFIIFFFSYLSTSIYSKCLPKIKLWAGFLSWKKRYLRDWWKDLLFFPETWFRTLPFVPWPPWWKGLFLHTIPCTYGARFINIAPLLF